MKTVFILLPVTLITIFILSCSGSEDSDKGGNNNGNTIDGITVTTLTITDVKTILATVNSKVDVDVTKAILVTKGIVWSTNTNPIIALPTKTIENNTSGNFQSQMTELQHSTTYYVRAYATDDKGNTVYGNEISFKTKVGWESIYAGEGCCFGIKTDGTLWGWGLNDNGQLGDGSSINKNKPVQIGSDNDWSKVFPCGINTGIPTNGHYTFAIKKDGTLWSWGKNASGQLGNGTNENKFTPIKISNDPWIKISGNGDFALGLKADGSVWGWGQLWYIIDPYNTTGLYLNVKTPMLINNIGACRDIYAGGLYCALFVKNNGTLWGVGKNNENILGLGASTTNTLITPIQQIGSNNNWSYIVCSYTSALGIQSNGNIYGWGQGTKGQFGNNTNSNYAVPTLITTNIGNNFSSISKGNFMTFIVKNDGSLFGTGEGYLGDGSPYGTSRFIFMNASPINTWKQVAKGYGTFAIQNNGSLWAWGENTFGGLGIGDNSDATVKTAFTLVE